MSLSDPEIRTFVENTAERAKALMRDSSARYEVCMLVTGRDVGGWPFWSRALSAIVCINEYRADGSFEQYVFWVDETGMSPLRWTGLLGNCLVYLLALVPVTWICDWAICEARVRMRRKRRGFPVVVEPEDAAEH